MTNPLEETWSQILRCHYVQFGCVWMTQFQHGEEADAQERRRIHQEMCVFRFHQPLF